MSLRDEVQAQLDALVDQIGTSGKGTIELGDGSKLTVDYTKPKPPPKRRDYSREELVGLCERAVVSEDRWTDRDSSSATTQLGELWALLKAGCDFHINKVDERTGMLNIWVTWRGFNWFEGTGDPDENRRDELKNDDTFYMPGEERLAQMEEGDWYC